MPVTKPGTASSAGIELRRNDQLCLVIAEYGRRGALAATPAVAGLRVPGVVALFAISSSSGVAERVTPARVVATNEAKSGAQGRARWQ